MRRPIPLIARLFDSLAPLVKTISAGLAPISAATCARAASTRLLRLPPVGVLLAVGIAEAIAEVRAASSRARVDRPAWWRGNRDRPAGHGIIAPIAATRAPEARRRDRLLGRWFGCDSLRGAGRQGGKNPVLDSPQGIAHAALRVLSAVLRLGRARGDGQRPVDRLDDVGDRDRRRRLDSVYPPRVP